MCRRGLWMTTLKKKKRIRKCVKGCWYGKSALFSPIERWGPFKINCSRTLLFDVTYSNWLTNYKGNKTCSYLCNLTFQYTSNMNMNVQDFLCFCSATWKLRLTCAEYPNINSAHYELKPNNGRIYPFAILHHCWCSRSGWSYHVPNSKSPMLQSYSQEVYDSYVTYVLPVNGVR